MNKIKGKITNISRDWKTGEGRVTIACDKSILPSLEKLLDTDLNISLTKFKKSRSLNANAYAWTLLNELSRELNITPEEIYKKCIKDIGGVSEAILVQNEAIDRFIENWNSKGIGWQAEITDRHIKNNTVIIVYYGSSTYNTEQMSRLIDSIIQECKEVNINTLTPKELQVLKDRWIA